MQPSEMIGHYKIIGGPFLGGFGEVYKVFDTEWGDNFALKTIRAISLQSSSRLALFRHEIELWIALPNHPYVVRAIRAFEYENRPYVLLEWIEGGDLGDEIHSLKTKGLSGSSFTHDIPEIWLTEILLMMGHISQAMIHIHDHGLIHGDIKPSNVLLKYGSIPQITDFGFSRLLNSENRGLSGGTPKYMAPELLWGPATVQSDVFATGVMFDETVSCLGKDDLGDSAIRGLIDDMTHPETSKRLNSFTPVLERLNEILGTLIVDWNPLKAINDDSTLEEERLTFEEKTLRDALPEKLLMQQAHTSITAGQLENAQGILERVLSQKEDQSDALLAMAELQIKKGETISALDYLGKARKACAGDSRHLYNVAVVYVEFKQFDTADEILNELEEQAESNELKSLVWFLRGHIGEQEGAISDAITSFRKAVAFEENPEAKLALARALGEAGFLDEAIEIARSLSANESLSVRSHLNLARLLISNQHYNDAIEHLNTCLQANLDDEITFYVLSEIGYSYMSQQRYKEAISYYEGCLKLNPKDKTTAANNLRYCQERISYNHEAL